MLMLYASWDMHTSVQVPRGTEYIVSLVSLWSETDVVGSA